MTTGRRYGQYCGLAKALELVGERWAMLVVRDLVLAPKSFPQLRESLRGAPATTLTARLNELEAGRVVQRRVDDGLAATVSYELTAYGRELEDIVYRLGLWGARSLGDPAADEVFTADSAVLSLRTTFVPDGGGPAVYVLDYGFAVVTARVDATSLDAGHGRADDPDVTLVFRGSPKPLFTGEVTPAGAVHSGLVVVDGDVDLVERFARLFCIPDAPAPVAPLVAVG